MNFLGCLVNAGAVFAFGIVGSLCKKGIPTRISQSLLAGMGLCVIYIGLADLVQYAAVYSKTEGVSSYHILIPILSMALGILIGEWVDIDRRMHTLGLWVQKKLTKEPPVASGEPHSFPFKEENTPSSGSRPANAIAEGFSAASILFCVGAMAVVGSIRAGLFADGQILIAKAVIDGIMALVMASSLGIGVALSAFSVLAYEGLLTGVAYFAGRAFAGGADIASVSASLAALPAMNEMTAVGGLIICAIGINTLLGTKIRVANFLPALAFPFLFCLFIS